jgi:uncharacterized protein (DUF1330 family)
MPAYIIYERKQVLDQARYLEYVRAVGPTIARFGGDVITARKTPAVLEGTWAPASLVIIRFPSKGQARAWYDSPEYAPLKELRLASTTGNMVIVEGD